MKYTPTTPTNQALAKKISAVLFSLAVVTLVVAFLQLLF